jgi:hypothetical protein
MQRLYTIVGEETNVEVSPESAKSTKSAKSTASAKSAARGKSTGPMSCRILHHPCNPKIKISADQLTEAALAIAETGKAPRIPESELIAQSRSASAATSAATSAAVSPE